MQPQDSGCYVVVSYHKLYQHKLNNGHTRKASQQPCKRTARDTIAQFLQTNNNNNNQDQPDVQGDVSASSLAGASSQPKRPRVDESLVGKTVKVKYDEGTAEERWWTGVVVERVAEFSYLVFFPNDREISEFNKEEIVVLEQGESKIGKSVKVPFATDDGEDELFDGIVVKALNASKLQVFFSMIIKLMM